MSNKVHYAIWDKWEWKGKTYSCVFLPTFARVTIHVDATQLEADLKVALNAPKTKFHLERDRDLHTIVTMNAIISQLYQDGLDLPNREIPVIVLSYNNFRGYF